MGVEGEMWKRIGAILASLVVSGVFLWLAVRDVPVDEVMGSIRQANPLWMVLVVVVGLIGIYTRAIRWRGLVDNRLSQTRAFYIVGIMQLMNVLPLRMGEVARTVLAARERIPIVTTASSIVVERLLDMLFVLGMLSIVMTQADTLPASVSQTVVTFSVLAAIALVVLILLARYPKFARNILNAVQNRVPVLKRLPLETLLDNALDGLKPLVDMGRLTHAVVWTFVSWLCSWLMFYFSQLALGVPAGALAFPTLSLSLAAFSVAVPLTVGAVGPFQAAVKVAGDVFAVNAITATAMGFLVHGLTIIDYVISGTWGFLGMGVSFGEVTKTKEKPKNTVGDEPIDATTI
jgi:uncharacterized protein (TIRG00374 family)